MYNCKRFFWHFNIDFFILKCSVFNLAVLQTNHINLISMRPTRAYNIIKIECSGHFKHCTSYVRMVSLINATSLEIGLNFVKVVGYRQFLATVMALEYLFLVLFIFGAF